MFSTEYANNSRIVSGGTTTPVYDDDSILLCQTSGGAITIDLTTIPANHWNTIWKLYVVDYSNNAGTNNITINAGSGQTINGSSSIVLNSNGAIALIRITSNTTFLASLSTAIVGNNGYEYVQNQTTPNLTQRNTIRFVGAGVTASDNAIDSVTEVTISGGLSQAYQYVKDEGGSALTQRNTLNFVGAGVTATDNPITSQTDITISGGLSQAYQTIQDEGSPVTQRSTINFIGSGVTASDDPVNQVTQVTISSGIGQAYQTIQDEGGDLPQQSKLNFIGNIVTATNNIPNSRTDVTIEIFTSLTRSAMLTLISTNSLIQGKFYYITDASPSLPSCAGVVVQALSTTYISTDAHGFFYNADYQGVGSYSGSPTFCGIWSDYVPASFTSDNSVVIYDNIHWKNVGNVWSPEPNSSTNWTQLGYNTGNGYIFEIDPVRYNIDTNAIIWRADRRQNEVYTGTGAIHGSNTIRDFQWGRDACVGNTLSNDGYMSCTNSNANLKYNALNGGTIYDRTNANPLSASASISYNTLTSGGYITTNASTTSTYTPITSNSLTGGSYIAVTIQSDENSIIQSNELSGGSYISVGTLVSTEVFRNVLSSASSFQISSLTSSFVNYNTCTNSSYIQTNGALTSFTANYNTLIDNSKITLSGTSSAGWQFIHNYAHNVGWLTDTSSTRSLSNSVNGCEFSDKVYIDLSYYADGYALEEKKYRTNFSNWTYTLDLSDEAIYDSGTSTLTIVSDLYWVGIFTLTNSNASTINKIIGSPTNHEFTFITGVTTTAPNNYVEYIGTLFSTATANKIVYGSFVKLGVDLNPQCFYNTGKASDYAKFLWQSGATTSLNELTWITSFV